MKLRAAREASGKTQKQVARESGVTERTYLYYETKSMEPGAKTAIRIAQALNSTVEELFGAATPNNTKEPDGNQAE